MKPIDRRTVLHAGLALGAAMQWRQVHACEYFAANLRITHPWTRATPADAPYALMGLRIDEVTQDDRLLAVETPVAASVVYVPHANAAPASLPLAITAGHDTVLGDSGPHLRLLGLTQPLELGRSYPLRLVFEKGGSVKATLNVDYTRFR